MYYPRCPCGNVLVRISNAIGDVKKTKLTHLCPVDDFVVFSHGDTKSIGIILQVLNRDIGRVAEVVGLGFRTLPVHYLEVLLIIRGLRASNCKILEDNIPQRLTSWRSKFPFIHGTVALIK